MANKKSEYLSRCSHCFSFVILTVITVIIYLKNQICESLRRNYPNALTMNEVFDDIGLKFDWETHPILSFLGAWGVSSVFDELVEEGEIESKIIEGKETHYRLNK